MLRRITLLTAGSALLAVVLFAIPLGLLVSHGYVNDERLRLQQAATSAASSLRGELTSQLPDSGLPGEVDVSVYGADGRRVSGSGSTGVLATVRSALRGRETTSTTSDRIIVAAPVSDGDRVTGAVLVNSSLAAAHRRAVTAWLVLAGVGVLAVALSALVARVIARRLAAPIERLTATARRMSDGDLSARASRSGVPEIDVLVAALNAGAAEVESMIARERGFSAEVSHQLRTPLAGLRLELESAQAASPDVMPGQLARALGTLDRLDSTITDVIALARDLSRGASTTVAALLADVQRRWHGALAAENRPLRIVASDAGAPAIAISAAASAQILDVLIDNARVHGRGAVTVAVRRSGVLIAIDVSDEGPDLDVDSHELFQRRELRDGHGIGLSFGRRLAEAEDARLVMTNRAPPTFSLIAATGPSTGFVPGDS